MEEVKVLSNKELNEAFRAMVAVIESLSERVKKLEESKAAKGSTREMTDDDARRVMYGGDLDEKSHKDAAAALGLSYGQIYSARLGFTFKNVHKEGREAGKKNRWAK